MRHGIIALALIAAIAPAAGAAQTQKQPNVSDIATCNREAEAAAPAPSASPRLEPGRPPASRRLPDSAHGGVPAAADQDARQAPQFGGTVGGPTDSTGQAITNPADPRLEGMAAARANDPAYRDAYRACMNRLGY